jgi:hypothetical protein
MDIYQYTATCIKLQTVTSQQKSGLLFPAVENSHIKPCNFSDTLTFPHATYIVPQANSPFIITVKPKLLNRFQSRDAIWHHTFNSVLHMLQFWGAVKGLALPAQKIVAFFGIERVNHFQPKNCSM